MTITDLTRHADPDWRNRSSCNGLGDLMFPDAEQPNRDLHDAQVTKAKQVCRGCPVATDCLNYALTTGETYGIWGGMTDHERRALKRRLNALQRAA